MEPVILGCPICYQIFEDPRFLDCGHGFCLSCIESALSNKNECPVCRDPVGEDPFARQLKRIYVVEETVRKIRSFVSDKNQKMLVANQERLSVQEENKALREKNQELKRNLEVYKKRTEEAYESLRKKRIRVKNLKATFFNSICQSVRNLQRVGDQHVMDDESDDDEMDYPIEQK